jgi:hypothetical protein
MGAGSAMHLAQNFGDNRLARRDGPGSVYGY